jgi:predicted Zn-dependent peptidase
LTAERGAVPVNGEVSARAGDTLWGASVGACRPPKQLAHPHGGGETEAQPLSRPDFAPSAVGQIYIEEVYPRLTITRYDDARTMRKTILDNGLRIITEELPFLQSVAMGVWVRSGSRIETPAVNGISHFIEHMVFKGTHRRSAITIAQEIDAVGGALNAFTSKELTAFYCRVLGENVDLASDLLSDIFLDPSFPEDEIWREKQVVVQEIHQLEDSPEDLVHEIMGVRFWHNDPLGQPILGSIANVENLDRETVLQYKNRHYTAPDTVVCAAGNLDHDRLVAVFEKGLGGLPGGTPTVWTPAAPSESSAHVVESDLEQVHVCIGVDGPSKVDKRRHAGYLLNTILGGGWSSRLSQEIREKRGLAYMVYSFISSFSDTGMFGIHAGCDPGRLEELLEVAGRETFALAASMTEQEISTAKSHIRGNLILAMESSDARMNRLAKDEFYFGRHVSLDETLAALDAVTASDLAALAEEMLNQGRFSLVALGPVPSDTDLFGLFRAS